MLQANFLLPPLFTHPLGGIHTQQASERERHITMMHWIFTLLWICVLAAPAARHSFISMIFL